MQPDRTEYYKQHYRKNLEENRRRRREYYRNVLRYDQAYLARKKVTSLEYSRDNRVALKVSETLHVPIAEARRMLGIEYVRKRRSKKPPSGQA